MLDLLCFALCEAIRKEGNEERAGGTVECSGVAVALKAERFNMVEQRSKRQMRQRAG